VTKSAAAPDNRAAAALDERPVMSLLDQQFGLPPEPNARRLAFLKWQCHTRQIAMRENMGRPDDAITPAVTLTGESEPLGHIITLICKLPAYSVTAELNHILAKTHDPAQRREQALRFLSAAHYQKAAEFSDVLVATFPPRSPGAAKLREAEVVRLDFEAYAQKYALHCRVWTIAPHNFLYQTTMAHNRLFNPALPPDTVVLGFEPDWKLSTSTP